MKPTDYSGYLAGRAKDFNPAWTISQVDETTYTARTPNQVPLTLTTPDNYTYVPENQYQSTMLWYHSLAWLKVIATQYQDYEFINKALKDYYLFVFSDAYEETLATLTSRDHLTAEQIRSLTYLLATEKVEEPWLCHQMLLKLTGWAMDSQNVKNNNHGMMMMAALLHVPLFIDLDSPKELRDYATRHLINIVENAFDSSGLCRENSPIYHRFYITYLTRLIEELQFIFPADAEADVTDTLKGILNRAERSIQEIALPDGTLPPFGDGNTSPAFYEIASGTSSFYSAESGFFCSKKGTEKQKYFSIKSGYSSITHKHADDTSIFYWYNGKPIITDAGFFNYDWQDPRTLAVKTQLGHSGAFYRRYDHLYPAALYPLNKEPRVRSNLSHIIEGNLNILTANSIVDDTYRVERTVRFSHLNNILIEDKFSVKDESAEKVVRFLINKDFGLQKTDTGLQVTGPDFTLDIIVKRSQNISYDSGVVDDDQPIKGWVTDRPFHTLKPCWIIEITPQANSVLTNLILQEHQPNDSQSQTREESRKGNAFDELFKTSQMIQNITQFYS
ncbi:heparinase II/III domain-containing protein [Rothia nasimurium]|uniref:heparinase II/III domain-containing protein n=1 Tax=Rothia nasimurium TaxID=85336 RepID=UPI003BA1EF7C